MLFDHSQHWTDHKGFNMTLAGQEKLSEELSRLLSIAEGLLPLLMLALINDHDGMFPQQQLPEQNSSKHKVKPQS